MAKIPVLEFEPKIQVNDKTRYVAEKSFVTTGDTALSVMTVKPGVDGSAINVYNATVANRYLDWAFTADSFDIDATNNKIYFSEAGTDKTATVSSSTYTLATLLTAIDTALEAAGANDYTISSNGKDQITIVSTGQLVLDGTKGPNALLPHIGFKKLTSSGTSHQGRPVEYGIRKITLSINNGATATDGVFYQKVFSVLGDALYSTDGDLKVHEHDILKYVPVGRASFLNVHRRAQEKIVEWLDQQGFTNTSGDKYDKFHIIDVSEVKPWAIYLALEMIFREISNATDDVFHEKAEYYAKEALSARQRAIIRLDVDSDGVADEIDSPDTWSGSLYHR